MILTCDSHRIGQSVLTWDKNTVASIVWIDFPILLSFSCHDKLLYSIVLLVLLCSPKDPGVVIHGHFLYGLPATKDKKRDVGVEQNQVKVKELT